MITYNYKFVLSANNSTNQDSTDTATPSVRIALGVEYDGSAFHGWQVQAHSESTVQQELESALSKIADQPIRVICAGRTDTGVHATAQVIHFETTQPRDERAWLLGTNTHLSEHVRVRWAQSVSTEFHARFSATGRRYRYVIDNRPIRPAIMGRQLTWQCRPLNETLMQTAADSLVGEHDFTSYRAVHCQAKNPVRTVHHVRVERRGDLVIIDIHANAFLHHMVRNIAGVLMAIGCGKEKPDWAGEVLQHRDRKLGGVTAPAHGLYLIEIDYPDRFNIPWLPPSLPFLLD